MRRSTSPAVRPEPEPPKSEAIPVLLISEAAEELGISTDELERVIEAGEGEDVERRVGGGCAGE